MSGKIYSETLGTLISPETGTPYSLDELYGHKKSFISEINRKENSSDEIEQIDRRSLLLILFIISFIIGIFIFVLSH